MAEGEHKITLIFIINGENFSVETNINAPLTAAVQRVFRKAVTADDP